MAGERPPHRPGSPPGEAYADSGNLSARISIYAYRDDDVELIPWVLGLAAHGHAAIGMHSVALICRP